jgi:hypothetical protein
MISRRMLGIGVLAMAGDGLVRPLNAPPGIQAVPGVQPGSSQAVVIANKIIVVGSGGSGVFVYAPAPGLDNLIASIAAVAGTDPYGNPYPAGISGELQTNEIQFTSGASVVGQLAPVTLSGGLALDLLNLPFNSTAGTAANPTIITTDTWHSPGLLNGWADAAGFGGFRYQLTTHNSVRVVGTISATAASATTFFTLSGVYVPAVANGAPVGCTGGAPAGAVPQVRWDTSGNLSIVNAAAVPVAQSYFIDADIPLD